MDYTFWRAYIHNICRETQTSLRGNPTLSRQKHRQLTGVAGLICLIKQLLITGGRKEDAGHHFD